MKTALSITFFLLLVAGCSAPSGQNLSTLQGTVDPLLTRRTINLADYSGYTFFEVMTTEQGIRENLDADESEKFTVSNRESILAARDKFTDKVNRKILREFGNEGLNGFADLIDDLEGKQFNTRSIKSAIRSRGYTPWSIADFMTMASGAGTLVRINDENYYYNVSYESDEVKSGRSFGAGPKHKADDASYPFYLKELADYLQFNDDTAPFYETLMQILTKSDIAQVSELNEYGQTLLTDFVTIYTAELYRHIIAGLGGRAPWENDLAEVTMISIWSHETGKIQQDGELVNGSVTEWNGFGPNGSGVGITRRDRRSLQTKICNAVRELNPEIVAAFEKYVERRRSDCYRSIMETINDWDTQESVTDNADALTSSVVAFLKYTKDNAENIRSVIVH